MWTLGRYCCHLEASSILCNFDDVVNCLGSTSLGPDPTPQRHMFCFTRPCETSRPCKHHLTEASSDGGVMQSTRRSHTSQTGAALPSSPCAQGTAAAGGSGPAAAFSRYPTAVPPKLRRERAAAVNYAAWRAFSCFHAHPSVRGGNCSGMARTAFVQVAGAGAAAVDLLLSTHQSIA